MLYAPTLFFILYLILFNFVINSLDLLFVFINQLVFTLSLLSHFFAFPVLKPTRLIAISHLGFLTNLYHLLGIVFLIFFLL